MQGSSAENPSAARSLASPVSAPPPPDVHNPAILQPRRTGKPGGFGALPPTDPPPSQKGGKNSSGGGNGLPIGGAVVAVVAVGFLVYGYLPTGKSTPTPRPTPTPKKTGVGGLPANPSGKAPTPPVAATPGPPDPSRVTGLLMGAAPMARSTAERAARDLTTAAYRATKSLDEGQAQEITIQALRAGYKKALPVTSYDEAFAERRDYAAWEETLRPVGLLNSVRGVVDKVVAEEKAKDAPKPATPAPPTPIPPTPVPATPRPAATPRAEAPRQTRQPRRRETTATPAPRRNNPPQAVKPKPVTRTPVKPAIKQPRVNTAPRPSRPTRPRGDTGTNPLQLP
jgi:hypothetical protein